MWVFLVADNVVCDSKSKYNMDRDQPLFLGTEIMIVFELFHGLGDQSFSFSGVQCFSDLSKLGSLSYSGIQTDHGSKIVIILAIKDPDFYPWDQRSENNCLSH